MLLASRLPASPESTRLMFVVAGKVLKDEARLLDALASDAAERDQTLSAPQTTVHYVVNRPADKTAGSAPVDTVRPAARGAGAVRAELEEHATVPTAATSAHQLASDTAGAALKAQQQAQQQAHASASARSTDAQDEGRGVSTGDDAQDKIRVEIELGEADDSEDEMEPLEMLVAVDARMEEVLAAATRQLQQVGKGGSSVTVLEFGGRALRPSDSLQHLMRSLSLVLCPRAVASLRRAGGGRAVRGRWVGSGWLRPPAQGRGFPRTRNTPADHSLSALFSGNTSFARFRVATSRKKTRLERH